jgi:hypothetical protein
MAIQDLFGISFSDKKSRVLLFSVSVILLLRLASIGLMGLMPQDAYYYFYGEHLALSYYDHPPAIAYLLRLFTTIFGKKVFALKLADSLVSFFSLLAFYYLCRCFLSEHRAKNAFLLFFSTLLLTIVSLVSTPDTPLILCWTASLLSLYHAVFLNKKVYWIWSGLLMGLAFDSKYTGLLLPAGLILFLLLSNRYRKQFFSAWFWSFLVIFLITISPVIIWNIQNDFASFRFQSEERMESMGGFHVHIEDFLGVIGHQSAILLPVLFFALIFFLFKTFKKYRLRLTAIPDQRLFLLCFFIPVFAGFFFLSFFYWIKLNWMMPAYISGIIWVGLYLGKRWIRYQVLISLIVHLGLAIEIIFYPVQVKSDDTWVGWAELAQEVKAIKHAHPDDFIFSMDDYKTSAVLNFYLDEMVYGQNVVGEQALQFDFIGTDLNKLNGKNALFIDSDPDFTNEEKENDPPPQLSRYFDSIIALDPILIKKFGRTVRKFSVYACKNYHPKK